MLQGNVEPTILSSQNLTANLIIATSKTSMYHVFLKFTELKIFYVRHIGLIILNY